MNKILEGVPGVICHMDDVLIHGTTKEEHERVDEVMERIKRSGMTLNSKCEFSMTSTKFDLGFIIDEGGIHGDPSKVAACDIQVPGTTECHGITTISRHGEPDGQICLQLDLPDQSTQRVTPQGRGVDVGHSPAE